MIQEHVVGIGDSYIQTESGMKFPTGDRDFTVGQSVWTEGDYVLGGQRRGGQRAMFIPKTTIFFGLYCYHDMATRKEYWGAMSFDEKGNVKTYTGLTIPVTNYTQLLGHIYDNQAEFYIITDYNTSAVSLVDANTGVKTDLTDSNSNPVYSRLSWAMIGGVPTLLSADSENIWLYTNSGKDSINVVNNIDTAAIEKSVSALYETALDVLGLTTSNSQYKVSTYSAPDFSTIHSTIAGIYCTYNGNTYLAKVDNPSISQTTNVPGVDTATWQAVNIASLYTWENGSIGVTTVPAKSIIIQINTDGSGQEYYYAASAITDLPTQDVHEPSTWSGVQQITFAAIEDYIISNEKSIASGIINQDGSWQSIVEVGCIVTKEMAIFIGGVQVGTIGTGPSSEGTAFFEVNNVGNIEALENDVHQQYYIDTANQDSTRKNLYGIGNNVYIPLYTPVVSPADANSSSPKKLLQFGYYLDLSGNLINSDGQTVNSTGLSIAAICMDSDSKIVYRGSNGYGIINKSDKSVTKISGSAYAYNLVSIGGEISPSILSKYISNKS